MGSSTILPGRHAYVIFATLLGAMLACGDRERFSDDLGHITVTDSMGIRIVTSPRPAPGMATWKSLAPSSELELGQGQAGHPGFRDIRAGILVGDRADPVVIVSDAISRSEIVVERFLADSKYSQVGGSGEGPGDLQAGIGLFTISATEFAVWDSRLARWSRFDNHGRFMSLLNIDRVPIGLGVQRSALRIQANLRPHGILDDGTLLATTSWVRTAATNGQFADSMTVWVVDTIGHLRRVNDMYESTSFIVQHGDAVLAGTLPFFASGAVAPAGANWAAIDGKAFQVNFYSADPKLVQIARLAETPPRLLDADAHSVVNAMVLDEGMPPASAKAIEGVLAFPDTWPTYDALISTRDSLLWAHRATRDDSTAVERFDIYRFTGEYCGLVSLPHQSRILSASGDWLLLMTQDSLGTPMIRLTSLTPGNHACEN